MIAAPIPGNEPERLAALQRYHILDTTPEEAFDELVQLASTICGAPIALISLVDTSRQWFKARVGLDPSETTRSISFCAHAIDCEDLFVVADALADPRFATNPLVLGEPHIRFYAGAPLTSAEGLHLGTLCVIDRRPRVLDGTQRYVLLALARQVMFHLELRRQIIERDITDAREVDRLKKDFVATIGHELRTPLTSIRGSVGLLAAGLMGELTPEAKKMVAVAERNSIRLMTLINDILDFEGETTRRR